MYCCLIKQLPFETPFSSSDVPCFNASSCNTDKPPVATFGLHGFHAGNERELAQARQVRVIWHSFVPYTELAGVDGLNLAPGSNSSSRCSPRAGRTG